LDLSALGKEENLWGTALTTVSHNVPQSQQPNKIIFSSRLNHWKLLSACRSSVGRLFDSFGPAAAKHLSQQLLYVCLTTRPWCGRM